MSLDVLKDLQERVSALEQQLADPVGADNLQPNVLTVNPDGTIGATFTGHVKASGVDLAEYTVSGGGGLAPNIIDWQSGGITEEYIVGELTAGGRYLRLAVGHADGTSDAALLGLGANGTFVNIGGTQVEILDPGGASSFLQLLSSLKLQIALGTDTFVFAASTTSGVRTINHGLGRVPQVILLTIQNAIAQLVVPAYGSASAASFPTVAYTTAAATVNIPYSWVAIG